jgi:hypothetical protein
MAIKRKQYLIDRPIQITISLKFLIIPLLILVIFAGILLSFVLTNGDYIAQIAGNQDSLIEMFITTPTLMDSNNEIVVTGEKTFRENLGLLRAIKVNNYTLLYFAIGLTILQAIVLFVYGIYITHKVAGPIYVMRHYCKEIQNGNTPQFRKLRGGDLLVDFYNDFITTINTLQDKDVSKS